MASVVFERVTKRFNDTIAVNAFNLAIEDGEFLVLVGPSGCGKTTSLRMLAGLEPITDGSIYIQGRRVNGLSPRDRNVAMVFQSYALYPHMSVYENMAFSLELQRLSRAEIRQRVQIAAKQMGITDLLTRKPSELSGGQRQRVAVGRAIVRDPAVFLMDEPLSNLDAQLRMQARTEISKLHQTLGSTFVYVTHDQVEAMTMGTRIAVMNHGILQQVAPPKQLYTDPANVFVAGFIGSPAMNLFEAMLVRQDGQLLLTGEGFQFEVPHWGRQLGRSPYDAYIGRRVIVGIRPEAIYDPNFVPMGTATTPIFATITVIETMGNEIIVYFKPVCALTPSDELIARVDRRSPLQPGQAASMAMDLSTIHVFDLETHQRIEPQP